MRPLFLVVVLIALFSSGCGDEQAINPCKVFRTQQVSQFVGGQVQPGKVTGVGEGCVYMPAGDSQTTFTVSVESDDTASKFAEAKRVAEMQAIPQVLTGLGDEAFVYEKAPVASAEARSGSNRVRILLQGGSPTAEQAKNALEQALRVLKITKQRH